MISTVLTTGIIALSITMSQISAGTPNVTVYNNVTICIDPGHGGDNSGAIYNGIYEKDRNLRIALSMKEELERYSGVTVVMTRESDISLTLWERSEVARDNNADLMISLHLNASGTHTQHGTEVWASAGKDQHGEAKSFGNIVLSDLTTALGTNKRAVKTRLNETGRNDYYGVIRSAEEYQIPCVIIEHCYMDNPADSGLWETDEACKKIGQTDAIAAAKCFGLKSPEHDFTNFHRIVKAPTEDWVTGIYDKGTPAAPNNESGQVTCGDSHATISPKSQIHSIEESKTK